MQHSLPLNFILPREFEQLVPELLRMKRVEDFPYWLPGSVIWSGLSFVILRQFLENITIGTVPVIGKINFAHVQTWRALGARNGEFRISARADYPRLFDTDFEILQNPAQKMHPNAIFLPHWPVPNLLPRDPRRRGVKTIAYAGRVGNGNFAREFIETDSKMKSLEVSIIPPDRWHDLSKVDVLIAVRSFDRKTYDSKPPSKLFCSWLARIPLVAGWDSAFSAIGIPNVNYIRIDSASTFLSEIERLVEDETYYQAIVQSSSKHLDGLQFEALAEVWIRALRGPISERFEKFEVGGDLSLRQGVNSSLDAMRGAVGKIKNALSN